MLTGALKHIYLSPSRLTPTTGPSALFLPMKIASRVPLMDVDYNLHKSNSTYFADLDMARLHLLTGLISSGMNKTGKELGRSWPVAIILGSVSCTFRREIKPYEGFEVWSRILCWDRKWLYVISHFVKRGSVRPKGYLLQPWRNAKLVKSQHAKKKSATNEPSAANANGAVTKTATNPAVFASSIAKYVFKHGSLTIPPERILQSSNLLPPNPEAPLISPTPTPDFPSQPPNLTAALPAKPTEDDEEKEQSRKPPPDKVPTAEDKPEKWDWARIETERARGMRIAELFAGLEMVNEELSYDGEWALGEYKDLY